MGNTTTVKNCTNCDLYAICKVRWYFLSPEAADRMRSIANNGAMYSNPFDALGRMLAENCRFYEEEKTD